jgi:hypothetical protein
VTSAPLIRGSFAVKISAEEISAAGAPHAVFACGSSDVNSISTTPLHAAPR